MFEKLRLINFQSHKDTEVVFSPGINVFRGMSRRGKTAIIRAIRWWATNEPKGDTFIRHGEKECSVEGIIDGHFITRKRTPSFNGYIVDGQEYKAGSDVPDAVKNIIKMSPVNWQFEHDGPYLLNETAGEVARQLNEITDLSEIDTSLKNLNSWSKSNKSEMKTTQSLYEEQKGVVSQYDYLDDMGKELEKLEELEQEVQSKQDAIKKLSVAVDELQEIQLRYERALEIAKSREQLDKLLCEDEELDELSEEIEELENAIKVVTEIDEKLKQYPDRKTLEAHKQKLESFKEEKNAIKELQQSYNRLTKAVSGLKTINQQQEQHQAEIKELKKQLPEKCPKCGSILK